MTQSERFGIIERLLLARRGVVFDEIQSRLGVSLHLRGGGGLGIEEAGGEVL